MAALFALLLLLCLIALIVGMIRPSLVILWGKGDKTRKRVVAYYGSGFLISFLLAGIFASNSLDERFANHRGAVIASIEGELSSGRYETVLDSTKSYLRVAPEDSSLLALQSKAEKELALQREAEEELARQRQAKKERARQRAEEEKLARQREEQEKALALQREAKENLAQQQRAKEKRLKAELEETPSSNYELRESLYRRLVALDSWNKEYREKHHY